MNENRINKLRSNRSVYLGNIKLPLDPFQPLVDITFFIVLLACLKLNVFGMGLIVTTFVLGIGQVPSGNLGLAVLCGNLGAILGSITSTRLMLHFTAKELGKTAPAFLEVGPETAPAPKAKPKGLLRVLEAMMTGGKEGVQMGLGIIPGVLVICSLVMMLTNGPSENGTYTGAAFEGIALLPAAAARLDFLLAPLFGFSSAACLAVPVTALGSAGAALGMIPGLVASGMAGGNDIAVFIAMCMCWSGYLSTHVSMMDILHSTRFTGKAILSHTVGGLLAGMGAHWLFVLLQLLG